jgi:zinc and cadmium transporter
MGRFLSGLVVGPSVIRAGFGERKQSWPDRLARSLVVGAKEMDPWTSSIIAVSFISLVSLVGVFTLSLRREALRQALLCLVAFGAGGLLGDAFIHLIPHAAEELESSLSLATFTLTGFLAFFVLEKFLKWQHCHDIDCEPHHRELGTMNLVADGLHNFIDGAVIAASFLSSFGVGMATSLAVALHEVPQEIGDFAILIHSGFSRRRALLFNFLTALTAVLGAVLVLAIDQLSEISHYLIPFTAGGFVYIAASGLIPQLHREVEVKRSALQFLGLVLGMGVMALLLLVE